MARLAPYRPHHCLAPAAAVDGGGHGVGSLTGCAVHIGFWQDPQIVVAVASDLAFLLLFYVHVPPASLPDAAGHRRMDMWPRITLSLHGL